MTARKIQILGSRTCSSLFYSSQSTYSAHAHDEPSHRILNMSFNFFGSHNQSKNRTPNMYRSASTNRVSDDHHYHSSPPPASKVSTVLRALSLEATELPVYEPLSENSKKEKARAKFSENAVHVIPFVLLVCTLILWFFSNPEVDMRGNSIAAKIEGLTIEGEADTDGTGHLPVELGDLDLTKPAEEIIGISKTLNF